MRTCVTLILCAALLACATQPAVTRNRQAASAPLAAAEVDADYWWYAAFELPWPEQEPEPDFSTNLMIANEVIAPLLERRAGQFKLWRFHRRAARDSAGHRFSFIFYATPELAEAVYAEIRGDRTFASLERKGVILALHTNDPNAPTRPGLAGASDPDWAPQIQRAWPYFIMGASVMWLDLLQQEIDPAALHAQTTTAARLDYYRGVNDRLTKLWNEQGRHAFFHHLSGIFGYEPIEMRF